MADLRKKDSLGIRGYQIRSMTCHANNNDKTANRTNGRVKFRAIAKTSTKKESGIKE